MTDQIRDLLDNNIDELVQLEKIQKEINEEENDETNSTTDRRRRQD